MPAKSRRKPTTRGTLPPDRQPQAECRERSARWLAPLMAGALGVSGLAVYGASLASPFVFDDLHRIAADESVRDPTAIRMASRPVLMLSFALNYATSGLNPAVFRLTNILIHATSSCVLFGILRRTLAPLTRGGTQAGRATWLAFGAAWLWLLHPLHTQAVTYVWQRGESMMGLFYLLTIYCTIRSAEGMRPGAWGAAAVAAFVLGAGTKETIISAPLVALALDRTLLSGSFRAALRERWALYGAFLALGLLGLALLGVPTRFAATSQLTNLEYASAQPGVVLHYLRLALWPDTLCFDYAWPAPASATELLWSGPVVGAGVMVALIAFARGGRSGLAGIGLILALAPTSSFIVINDVAVEYRMYVPLAAVAAIAVGALVRIGTRAGAPASSTAVVVGLLGLALAWKTVDRNRAYESPVSLWQSTVEVAPHNARAHNQLSLALLGEGRTDEAFQHVERAVELDPEYGIAQANLGSALASRGQPDRAIEHLKLALRLIPPHDEGWLDVHLRLAGIWLSQGELEEAHKHLRRVLGADPKLDDVRRKLVRVLADLGRYRQASIDLLALVEPTPEDARLHLVLAAALLGKDRSGPALSSLRAAVSLDPRCADPASELLLRIVVASKGEPGQGALIEAMEAFCGGDRPEIDVLVRLAQAYSSVGRQPAALRTIERALVLVDGKDEARTNELRRQRDQYLMRSKQ